MARVLARLARRLRADGSVADSLYAAAVAQARRPSFYRSLAVPDTVRGRFELICLHVFLLFQRLGTAGEDGRACAQALHDVMFADMDRSLREMGIGDMGIGKRVKTLAANLQGRIHAYDSGLAAGNNDMAAALARNLYGTAAPTDAQLAALLAYVHEQRAALAGQDATRLLRGEVAFAPPPDGGSEPE